MDTKSKNVAEAVCAQRNCTLKGPLGSGAFKRAYLIERAGTAFALKIAVTTPELKPRFEREAAALSGCSHAAIAKLFESGACSVDGTEHWVSIEEYLAGVMPVGQILQIDHFAVWVPRADPKKLARCVLQGIR